MSTVWMVDDWRTSNASDICSKLAEFVALTGVALEVCQWPAADLEDLATVDGDVVVVFHGGEDSKLPDQPPPRLHSTCHLLPILETADHARFMKSYLSGTNAVIRDAVGPLLFDSAVADEIVTRAALPRQGRSVFISYQRNGTLAVARQLADQLELRGFTVFLDERAILPGTKFDAEIGYCLNDVDAVILLMTKDLSLSAAVRKEVAYASNAKIGFVAVDCDLSRRGSLPAMLAVGPDEVFTPATAIGSKLDEFAKCDLLKLVGRIYEQRAAGIVRRLKDLVPVAIDELKRRHERVGNGHRIGELTVAGTDTVARVLPFRPTAEVLWEMRCASPGAIEVVHPENVPTDPRVLALKWLALPVEQKVTLHDIKNLWI